jgi:soluble lytic murein transglycosylase-like protein
MRVPAALPAFACFAAALLPFAAYAAAPANPSEQYLALRRLSPPLRGLTLRALADQPAAYQGKTLEIEGRLTGVVRREEGAALMLSTDDYPTLTLYMSEAPTWLQPGERLRVLAVAISPEEAGGEEGQTVVMGVPDMRVVAVASASDIAAAEARWQQTAAARTARDRRTQFALRAAESTLNSPQPLPPRKGTSSRASTPLSSRGATTTAARTYGGGPLVGYLSEGAKNAYPRYFSFIKSHNRRLSDKEADAITSSILLFSERYQVDPRLVVALIIAESDFKPTTTSHKGAMGLGQLMPDEARTLRLSNPYDPVQNVAGAVYLLRGRLDKYSKGQDLNMQHIILALASYNAGMGAVKKYGGVPPYKETRNYVKKIEKLYRQLCGETQAG